jgi:ribonuclease D
VIDRTFCFLERDEDLRDWVAEHADSLDGAVIALDIEEDRERGYAPLVALIQVTIDDHDVIFDPLRLSKPALCEAIELVCLLPDAVVIHGSHNDVTGLKRDFGVGPKRLVDTQVAARFLGERAFGLAPLLASRLNIIHDKSVRRSDWTARPLGEEQLIYARADTSNLLDLWYDLEADLEESGWLDDFDDECAALNADQPEPQRLDPWGWRNLKGLGQLDQSAAQRLAALWGWRDRVGRERNLHVTRVLPPWALILLAERGSSALTRRRSSGLDPAIFDAEHEGLALLLDNPPDLPPPTPTAPRGAGLGRSESERRLELLLQWRNETAEATGLEPGFLASRTVLLDVARLLDPSPENIAAVADVRRWRADRYAQTWSDLMRRVG